MTNANEKYSQHNGSETYYRHWLPGYKYTEGVKAVADDYGAHWFLDVIVSWQTSAKVRKEPFQVWKLKRVKDDKFLVTCEDGNYKPLTKQQIDFSDFKDDELTIWLEECIMLLPSEH